MKTITTEEHFNKFSNLKNGINKISYLQLVRHLYKDIESLKNKFLEDKHLNNVNMNLIDDNFYNVRHLFLKNKKSWSLSDGCCLQKHILIYDVLKIKPIFEKDIKDFSKIKKNWLETKNYKKYPNEDNYYRKIKLI